MVRSAPARTAPLARAWRHKTSRSAAGRHKMATTTCDWHKQYHILFTNVGEGATRDMGTRILKADDKTVNTGASFVWFCIVAWDPVYPCLLRSSNPSVYHGGR